MIQKYIRLPKLICTIHAIFMNQPTDDQISSQGNYWHTSLKILFRNPSPLVFRFFRMRNPFQG